LHFVVEEGFLKVQTFVTTLESAYALEVQYDWIHLVQHKVH
jgi:hypothetical protein